MPGNSLIQSVERGLRALELVARSEHGLTLQELARALGVAPPTAHNLARTLLAHGYLEKASRPTRYRLGAAIFDLLQARRQRGILRRGASALQALAADFPAATLTFSEIIGGEVVPALRISPERPGVLQTGYGQPMHAYASASALLYQAYATETERQAYRRRHPFAEFGAHCWGALDALERELAAVRARGYADLARSGLQAQRRTAFAVPVISEGGEFAGALGGSLPALPDDPEALPRALQAAAARLSHE